MLYLLPSSNMLEPEACAIKHKEYALLCAGIDAAPKHAAKCRLQLAEYAVLECLNHQLLIQVLPKLGQQVGGSITWLYCAFNHFLAGMLHTDSSIKGAVRPAFCP